MIREFLKHSFLGKLLIRLLAANVVGRPLRKVLHLTHEFLRGCLWLISALYRRMPFLRVELVRDHFRKLFKPVIAYYNALEARGADLPYQPKISVIVPVYKVKRRYLWEALQSVVIQTYHNWELCIVDDASGDPEIEGLLEEFQQRYPEKVKYAVNPTNQHISATSNACLDLATGDYIALLDHDDRLYPNALGEMARYINLHDKPEILYSDERVVDDLGSPVGFPFFKPAYSPLLHLSVNYTTHLTLYSTELIKRIGGFRKGYEGSQDFDLMLRAVEASSKPVVHLPFCLYQWRAHEQSTAGSITAKPYAAEAGEKAVSEALARRNILADVEWEPETFHYRLRWKFHEHPLVSIIIPSKNALELVKNCLHSIFSKTTYPQFEVIVVDNGSDQAEVFKLYQEFEQQHGERFRHISAPGPFNFARLINTGVDAAKGEFVLLLNNDTEVVTPTWIEEMAGIARLDGVGAVGCKLLFNSGRIQHAGVAYIGPKIASNLGASRKEKDDVYNNLLNTIHEVSAVTAACMMIKTSVFNEVRQMDELWAPNGWGDVLFCMDLQRAGYRNVYTPYAVLHHFESPSRGVTLEYFEHFFLREKYGQELLYDKYFNPNLSDKSDYRVNGDYMSFELYEPMFQFLLEHERKDWTKETFDHYLKTHRIVPNGLLC